jgi:pimeloyl-ACP methyl ester carboxylesterase
VVLAHGAAYDAASWRAQAERLAGSGVTALAVEDTSAQSVAAAAGYLKEERGVRDVTLIGASAGTAGVLGAAEEDTRLVDGVILLSGTGEVSGLGEYPKLFVASEGEGLAGEVRRMADGAPGSRNEVLILPGDAHAQAIFETDQGERLMRVILERLKENG